MLRITITPNIKPNIKPIPITITNTNNNHTKNQTNINQILPFPAVAFRDSNSLRKLNWWEEELQFVKVHEYQVLWLAFSDAVGVGMKDCVKNPFPSAVILTSTQPTSRASLPRKLFQYPASSPPSAKKVASIKKLRR